MIGFLLLVISGCASSMSHVLKESSNHQNLIAYQSADSGLWENRTDIIIGTLDGKHRYNITRSLYSRENVCFVLPKWSPRGGELAFLGVQLAEQERYQQPKKFCIEVFIFNIESQRIQKIFSFKGKAFLSNVNTFHYENFYWADDGTRLLLNRFDFDGFNLASGRITQIAVSVKPPYSVLSSEVAIKDLKPFPGYFSTLSTDKQYEVILKDEDHFTPFPESTGYFDGLTFRIDLTRIIFIDHTTGKQYRIFPNAADIVCRWLYHDTFLIVSSRGDAEKFCTIETANPKRRFWRKGIFPDLHP